MTPPTKEAQRAELHKTIWRIANDLRGAVDGWDFKAYVLGMLFYRFISENLTAYLNEQEQKAGNKDFDYATLTDEQAERGRDDTVDEKGFYILPSELFANVRAKARIDENLNEALSAIFKNIEASAQGAESEDDFKGLFDDLDVNNQKLGNTVAKRNEKLVKLLDAIGDMELGKFADNTIDAFGDAYEYLMTMYAANAGKSGGEFFTPQEVSELLARITVVGKTEVNKVYDPACGSGSLLLKFAKVLGKDNVRQGFFGQEINLSTYNLCRINMFLHDIGFDKFDIAHGDVLLDPVHDDDEPFEAIVSNPPYSTKWDGDANPLLINDPRYSPAGVLAPKSKADLAFTMHMLSWLAVNGTAAIVEFPGVLYRGGAEKKIRKYLIDNNYVDTVIQLPPDLFFGTTIATCVIVLKKSKTDNETLFIDATNEFVRLGNKNKLTEENQQKILDAFIKRDEIEHFAHLVDNAVIAENDYNIAVTSYVEPPDTREVIDIKVLNAEIAGIVERQAKLRMEIDAIVAELEASRDSLISQQTRIGDVQPMKLAELFDMKAGAHVSASELVDVKDASHRFECYGGNGVRGFIDRFSHDGEFVLIGRQGALCGNVQRATGKFYATEHAVVVTVKPGVDVNWAFHALTAANLNQYASKSAQPGLAVNRIREVAIPTPSTKDQREIGSILDKFDDLVNDLTSGLPAEIAARRKQYEYYRDKLLTFKEAAT